MRVFFISNEASGVSLCHKIFQEGHDVRLFIECEDKLVTQALDGIVKKIGSIKEGVEWAGKDGLIVFDYMGYGDLQDELRKNGYSVVGGNKFGDKLEDNRQYGQKIISACGVEIAPSINFFSVSELIKYLKKNKGPWVIKQNGSSSKLLNYVGKLENNGDTISLLHNYKKNKYIKKQKVDFDLQKRICGVEVAVGRFFNGENWVGPLNINFEHKNFFNENLGPATYEMGTLMYYSKNENNKLYKATLNKLKPYLKKIKYKGYFDINCIVSGKEIFPLEATTRFGYPTIQLQMEIHQSPWGEFLKALADGKDYDLKWKKGYGIVVLVAAPPFPFYKKGVRDFSIKGTTVNFTDDWIEEDKKHIHLEAIMKGKNGELKVCDDMGYILHVSGIGETVAEARDKTYSVIKKIIVPKMYYRTDIGQKFIEEDEKSLRKWGWIE